jgi:hypothetical protein
MFTTTRRFFSSGLSVAARRVAAGKSFVAGRSAAGRSVAAVIARRSAVGGSLLLLGGFLMLKGSGVL